MKRLLFTLAVLLLPCVLWAASGSDNFERGAALPIDGSWNPISSSSNIGINAGVAYSDTSSGDAYAFFTAFTPTANQEATIQLNAFSGSGFRFAGVVLRAQGANDMYVCFATANIGGATTVINKLETGVGFTTLQQETSTTWAATDTLRCKIDGTTINLYRNGSGSPLISATDSTFSSGSLGMWITVENTSLDSAYIEQFSAADVAPAATVIRRRRAVIVQ